MVLIALRERRSANSRRRRRGTSLFQIAGRRWNRHEPFRCHMGQDPPRSASLHQAHPKETRPSPPPFLDSPPTTPLGSAPLPGPSVYLLCPFEATDRMDQVEAPTTDRTFRRCKRPIKYHRIGCHRSPSILGSLSLEAVLTEDRQCCCYSFANLVSPTNFVAATGATPPRPSKLLRRMPDPLESEPTILTD